MEPEVILIKQQMESLAKGHLFASISGCKLTITSPKLRSCYFNNPKHKKIPQLALHSHLFPPKELLKGIDH